MYWLVNADVPAVIGPMDRGDKWFFGCSLPDGMKLDGEHASALIRARPASTCRSRS